MKIIRIVGNNLGGGARMHVYMANEALSKLASMTVWTFIPKAPNRDIYSDEGIVPFNYRNSISVFLIAKYIWEMKPDYLWLHLRNVTIIWGAMCWFFGLKYIVTVHAPNGQNRTLREKFLRIAYRIFLLKAEKVYFVSNFIKEQLELELRCQFTEGIIIDNASKKIHVQPKENDYSEINIIIVGELTRRKGINLLPDVFEAIAQDPELSTKLRISIYGEGPLLNVIESACNQHSFVEYRGYESDLEVIYGSADVLLMYAKKEAFGRVVTEAASCGVYPLLYNSGAFPYLVQKLGVGTIFNDVREIVACLKNVLSLDLQDREAQREKLMKNFDLYFDAIVFETRLQKEVMNL